MQISSSESTRLIDEWRIFPDYASRDYGKALLQLLRNVVDKLFKYHKITMSNEGTEGAIPLLVTPIPQNSTELSHPASPPVSKADVAPVIATLSSLSLDAFLDQRKTTFRVRGIPSEYNVAATIALLERLLDLNSGHGLFVYSLTVDATTTKPSTLVSTIDFEYLPVKLSLKSGSSRWELPLDQSRQNFLLIDTSFLGLTTLASPCLEKHKLDIIAVSGLGGHAFGSFKEKNGSHMWLRDSLPKQLESARVLTWGHDSHLYRSDSFQDLEALGRAFLGDLQRITQCLTPKVFIGHSLGGLIIKQAIVLMHKHYDNLPLLEAIRGILCFGTPTQGLDITFLVPMVKGQPNEAFLHSLGNDSQLLREQSLQFNEAVSRRDIQLFAYYETKESPTARVNESTGRWQMTGTPQVLVRSSSARYGLESQKGSAVEPINRTHSEMVKFARGDGELDRVLGRLQIWEQSLSQFPTRAFTPSETECLRSLSFPEMNNRRNEVARATDTTCEWIFSNNEFLAWRRGETDLLWIKGKPGSGKSTLFRHVLDKLSKTYGEGQPRVLTLSYLFHGRGTELEKTRLGLLRSLSHQLFSRMPDTFRDLTELFQSRLMISGVVEEKWVWHVEELYENFQQALTLALETSSVQLMIDALDEAGEDTARELVADLENLTLTLKQTKFRFSVCFTCRHYPILSSYDGSSISTEDQNRDDIVVFIDKKFPELKRRAVEVRDKICQRAEGVFQWADLVSKEAVKALHRGRSMRAILKETANVPSDLTLLYKGLIDGLDRCDRDQAFRLFRWLCYSIEPLSLTELRLALILQSETSPASLTECREHEDYIDSDESMSLRLTHLSCGLAEIRKFKSHMNDENDEFWYTQVQFIHQSVQDFFKECTLFHFQDQSMTLSISEHYSHCLLAWACANCVALDDFQDDSIKSSSNGEFRNTRGGGFISTYGGREPRFSNYAVANFTEHVKLAQAASSNCTSSDIVSSFRRLGLKWMRYINTWAIMLHTRKFRPDKPLENQTLLHFALRYSLLSLLPEMPLQFFDEALDEKDSGGYSALYLAAERGHEEFVQLLLETNKVDVNCQNNVNGRSPLSAAACRQGYVKIVELLLATDGVDINIKDNKQQTPLALAAMYGNIEVAKLLLGRDEVQVDSRDQRGCSPLYLAISDADSNAVELVELLLATGKVDVNVKNTDDYSALSIAALKGKVELVRLLLATDRVDVNSGNDQECSPMSAAFFSGKVEIMKMLLATGKVDLSRSDDSGMTPLFSAVGNEEIEVVEMLLATGGVDVNSRHITSLTPLLAATLEGNVDIMKLLIQNGADINMKDLEDRSVLFFTARYGRLDSISYILSLWTESLHDTNRVGLTAIMTACRNGHAEVVEALLDASMQKNDPIIDTPNDLLLWGKRSGNQKVVDVLVHHYRSNCLDFSLNLEIGKNSTPFSPDLAWCDICTLSIDRSAACYTCERCGGGRFLVGCSECVENGARCRDTSHVWVECDGAWRGTQ